VKATNSRLGEQFLNITIIVLLAIAVILGYKIYKVKGFKIPSDQSFQSSPTPTVNPEEKEVLNFPEPSASNEEKKKHSQLVLKLAKETDTIDITNCQPEPLVVYLDRGDKLTFKNQDEEPHKIKWGGKDTEITNGMTVISASQVFGSEVGDYGYLCDGSEKPVGVVKIH